MRKLGNFTAFLVMAAFAFLGGAASDYLILRIDPAMAQKFANTGYFNLHDNLNPKGIETYVHKGYPAQNFYARDGYLRLQQGIYNTPGEDGLPMIGLYDNRGALKMLFRLAGSNESPVIIMKDNRQRDRMVFGLDMEGEAENPFLAVFDETGQKKMLLGSYNN